MTEEQLKWAVTNLLFDLHSVQKLTEFMVDAISRNFKLDANELCETNGITYFMEE